MRYDLESFCNDLKAVLQANLNTRLAAIDAEKNGGKTLKQISNSAYFFQSLDEKTANYDPYLVYSVEDIETLTSGPCIGIKPTVHIVIVLSDRGQDTAGITARMLRYQRALLEVFETNWTENTNRVKIEIQSLAPVAFSLINASHAFRAIGVAVKAEIL